MTSVRQVLGVLYTALLVMSFIVYPPTTNSAAENLVVTSEPVVTIRTTKKVQVTLLTNEQLLWEFDQSGGYLNPRAKPRDLRSKILDDLGYYQVIMKQDGSTHRSYEGYQLPKSFVRKTRYSKSGKENPTVSYHFHKELLSTVFLITNREEVDLLIENLLDRGDLKEMSHYYFGCLQTQKEIIDIFNVYATTHTDPFPCAVGYNHYTRMVEVFKKVYKISDVSKIDDLKTQIAREYGEKIAKTMRKADEYKAGMEESIKERRTTITFQGDKIIDGYLELVVLDGKIRHKIVQYKNIIEVPDMSGKILLEDLLKSGGLVAHLSNKAEGNDATKVQDVAYKALLEKKSGKKYLEGTATIALLNNLLEKYPVNKSRSITADDVNGTKWVVIHKRTRRTAPAIRGFDTLGVHHQNHSPK